VIGRPPRAGVAVSALT